MFIQNTGGTLTDLVVTDSTFSNNGASTHAGDAFEINLASAGVAGSPTATVHATHNTFSGNLTTPSTYTATGFAGAADDGTLNVHLGDGTAGGLNTFSTNNSGITLSASNTGNLNFDVNDNTVNINRAVGITVNNFGSGTVNGFLSNNVVGQQGLAGSGARIGDGINLDDEGNGNTTILVDSNIVQSVGDGVGSGFNGIFAQKLVGAQNSSGTFNLTITNNTIRDILDDAGLFAVDQNTAGNSHMNLDVHGNTFTNADGGTSNPKYAMRIGGAPAGTDHVNVPQASAAAVAAANGLVAGGGVGQARVDTNVFFSQAAPTQPTATPQLALNGQGPASSDDLTMAALAPLLLAAIQHWSDAGASSAQIALLENTQIHISDLPNSGILANTDANGITIDTNGAGWGWFIDPTPASNSEFSATTTPHDYKASSGDAASHIDLLTVIEHEMGHVLGLDDSSQSGIMNLNLDVGERREPDAADVAQADQTLFFFKNIEPTAPSPGAATGASLTPSQLGGPAGASIVTGTPGNDTINAGHGGATLFGGAGANSFVFANVDYHAPAAPPLTHVADYSFAEGDRFDFSAITSQFHASGMADGYIVRAVEDASGMFATLQVDTIDPMGMPGLPNWVNVAQIDGAHAGDAVNVLIDGSAVHLAQLHVGLLA